MSRLEIRHLSVDYTMKRTGRTMRAVHDISFVVAGGEFVALLGPSGCGKTTVLHAVAGILEDYSGEVRINDHANPPPGQDRALVFQSPALLPWRTVAGNVVYGLELQQQPALRAQAEAQRCIELVGLSGFEESYPDELSGGMQQRANLARALAVRPNVLLFDEPLSALDAQSREYMQAELQRIWLEEQTTALYVTHHISEAVFLADRVIVLSASPGRVKATVSVPFARPRALKLQRTPPFMAIVDQIWDLLDAPPGV